MAYWPREFLLSLFFVISVYLMVLFRQLVDGVSFSSFLGGFCLLLSWMPRGMFFVKHAVTCTVQPLPPLQLLPPGLDATIYTYLPARPRLYLALAPGWVALFSWCCLS